MDCGSRTCEPRLYLSLRPAALSCHPVVGNVPVVVLVLVDVVVLAVVAAVVVVGTVCVVVGVVPVSSTSAPSIKTAALGPAAAGKAAATLGLPQTTCSLGEIDPDMQKPTPNTPDTSRCMSFQNNEQEL